MRYFPLLNLALAGLFLSIGSASAQSGSGAVGRKEKVQLTIVATPREGGSVSGAGLYVMGTAVDVVAVPRAHYRFVEWAGAPVVNPSSARTQLYMGKVPQSLVAIFEPEQVELKVRAEPENGGIVGGGGFRPYGGQVPVTAQAHPGFEFVGWEGPVQDPRAEQTRLAQPLTPGMTVMAKFRPQEAQFALSVVAVPAAGGTVSGGGNFARGTQAEIRAVAAPGFFFNGWDGAASDKGKPATKVFIKENCEVRAQFVAESVMVGATVFPEGAGTVTGDLGPMAWTKKRKIKALPREGYAFERWESGVFSSSEAEIIFQPTRGETTLLKAVFRRTN